jgi:hypothetical protein
MFDLPDFDDLDDLDRRDPRNPSAFKRLDRAALKRALESLRYLDQFHTLDLVKHPITAMAHREELEREDFPMIVEAWLDQEALMLGLRGPLPGHVARGKRWAWLSAAVDPSRSR